MNFQVIFTDRMPTAAIAFLPPKTVARRISEIDLKLPVGIVFQPEASFPNSALNSLILDLKAAHLDTTE